MNIFSKLLGRWKLSVRRIPGGGTQDSTRRIQKFVIIISGREKG
jgi:hypothetical protein